MRTVTSRYAGSATRASSTSFQDAGPEPAGHDALLEGHQQLLATRLVEDELAIERLGVAGIDDTDRPALLLEHVGRLATALHDGPEPHYQDLTALTEHLAHPDRENLRSPHGDAEAGVARVVQRERVILGKSGPHERPQLLLVLGAGDDHVRQLALCRQGEHALVARPVLTHQTGPVDGDHHGQIVLTDVVDLLVEGPLQERGIERPPWPLTCEGHARGQRHGMLLGDSDVDEAIRELRLERVKTRPGGHPCGDGHYPAIPSAPTL